MRPETSGQPSPEQATGEGDQSGVEAHPVQALQLLLGGQQPIEGIPVGLSVATGAHTMLTKTVAAGSSMAA